MNISLEFSLKFKITRKSANQVRTKWPQHRNKQDKWKDDEKFGYFTEDYDINKIIPELSQVKNNKVEKTEGLRVSNTRKSRVGS